MKTRDTRWEDLIARITYKPDFKLSVTYMPDYEHQKLTIKMRVPNSRTTNQEIIPVTSTHVLEAWDYYPEGYHIELVRGLIERLELHEMDEWFKVDGVMYRDPHEGENR